MIDPRDANICRKTRHKSEGSGFKSRCQAINFFLTKFQLKTNSKKNFQQTDVTSLRGNFLLRALHQDEAVHRREDLGRRRLGHEVSRMIRRLPEQPLGQVELSLARTVVVPGDLPTNKSIIKMPVIICPNHSNVQVKSVI